MRKGYYAYRNTIGKNFLTLRTKFLKIKKRKTVKIALFVELFSLLCILPA